MEYYLFAGNHLHLHPVKCTWTNNKAEFSLDDSAEYNGTLDPKILTKACQARIVDLEKIVKNLDQRGYVARLQILLIPV